jgi:hypothetical protein
MDLTLTLLSSLSLTHPERKIKDQNLYTNLYRRSVHPSEPSVFARFFLV